ncbi:MAG: hypothetical protein ACR2N5_00260 [Solirubrobacterales bacterium]
MAGHRFAGPRGPATQRSRLSRVLFLALTAIVAASLVACGGEAETEPGQPVPVSGDDPDANLGPEFAEADPEEVEVIRGWVDALRAGNIDEAAEFFALPSVAENGSVLFQITNRGDARAFNRLLPCGAILVGAKSVGDFTTAQFELTERPGDGVCGAPPGATASTAFVISEGKIAEWRRVGEDGEPPPNGRAA